MKKACDELDGIMKVFRQTRALEYDKKYNREHDIGQKNAHFAELYEKLEKALGKTDGHLLGQYTDSVIELYNTDADYFYNCGFDDCQQLYSRLLNVPGISRVGDDEEEEEGDPNFDLTAEVAGNEGTD